jgi:Flp pilus assembly CpaF family ATPase
MAGTGSAETDLRAREHGQQERMKVTPFQASIATGLLTVGATWVGARINWASQAKREREAREAERRHVFERETLISLQDAVDALYRLVQELVLVERFSPEMDDHQAVDHPVVPEPMIYLTAQGEVEKLQGRVLDDALRARIDALVDEAGMVVVATTRHDAEHRWDDLTELVVEVNERIGARVRHLFGA